MPERDGKLTADEKQRIVDTLNGYEAKNERELACEVCGGTLWVVNDYLIGMASDNPAGPLGRTFRTPSVGLICSGCGHIKFFAGRRLGVTPLLAEAVEEPDNGG